jgi:hypothetical protein
VAGGMKLTSHHHLVPRLRMCVELYLYSPIHVVLSQAQGTTLLLLYFTSEYVSSQEYPMNTGLILSGLKPKLV